MKTKKQKKKSKTAKQKKYVYNCFTLTEIMVAMAIVGILASLALVSLGSYRTKANAEKVNASLSSATASIASCISMGGKVKQPTNGVNICTFSTSSTSAYGTWPNLTTLATNYSYINPSNPDCPSGYGYLEENNLNAEVKDGWLITAAHAGAAVEFPKCLPQTSWYFSAQNNVDSVKICCNDKMKGCKRIDYGATCDNTIN